MLSFFLPQTCIGCREHIGQRYGDELLEKYLCANCSRAFHLLDVPSSDQLADIESRFTSFDTKITITAALNFSEPSDIVRLLIHQSKYNSMMRLATTLGELSSERLPSELANFDYIVPIPLHRSRIAERGYNQSELIARGLATHIGVKLAPRKILTRIKPTPTQTGLDAEGREENMRGAFETSKGAAIFKNKRVILIDDVMTTGATLASAAAEIDKAKPQAIAIASVGAVIVR